MGLVDDGDGRRAPQMAGVRLALDLGHQVAGGVLEVGDQVGQPGSYLSERGADGVEVPPLRIDRTSPHPAAGRVGNAWIALG